MRYLSKVVFINSAHIHYGEVELNGNVHFTGTQGVGKSTLLRAILFFYNADKMHLGIRQQDQRTFDEFYLPYPTSYIIYEVERGGQEGPFSILVFKHHNRAVYRFVDAPFDARWLIDEAGNVTHNMQVVAQRIRELGHDHSRLIEHYEHYRDILYGNRHGQVKADERKYHLLESTSYQNIPRIIQNVFLNERVDAGFIKDTIIQSLGNGEEEAGLDLRFYRSQLSDFTNEFDDIMLWSRKNRRGEVEVRQRADRLIETGHAVKALRMNLEEGCAQLKYAMKKAEQQLPVLRKRIGELREQVGILQEKIKHLTEDFDNKRAQLNRDIGAVEDKMREARRKQKAYREGGIEAMLKRANQEESWLTQRGELLKQMDAFNRQYESITAKYNAMIERLEIERTKFAQVQKESLMMHREAFNQKQQVQQQQLNEQLERIDQHFSALERELQQQLEQAKNHLHELDLKLLTNASSHPMKAQTDEAERQLAELKDKQHHMENELLKEEAVLKDFYQQVQQEEREIREARRPDAEALKLAQTRLQEKLAEERALLENAKGSLCEWLDAHVPHWADTIGKVVDERQVLFHTALSPSLSSGQEHPSLYGVDIDLTEVERTVRTPADIEAHCQELSKQLEENERRQLETAQQTEQAVNDMAARWDKRIKPQKERVDVMRQQLKLFPQKIKEAQLRLDDLLQEELELKQRTEQALKHEKDQWQVKLDELQQQHGQLKATRDNRLQQARTQHRKAEKEARKALEAIETETERAIQAHHAEVERQIEACRKRLSAELTSEGAETSLLDELTKKLHEAEAWLQRIQGEKETVSRYRYDCQQLFDHMQEFQTKRDKLHAESEELQRKYDEKQAKMSEKRDQLNAHLQQASKEADDMATGLAEAEDYILTDSCPGCLHEVPEMRTTKPCGLLVKELMQGVSSLFTRENKLKEDVNAFRGMLSPRNTFKFPTELDTTDHYLAYAENVDDFVTNNKINDVQRLTSSMYTDIMARISRDFNDLVNHESEIIRVVNDVNYDFTQRSFAGVIRGMQLRLERSKQPLVTLLDEVCHFWNAHEMDLGEANLFSTDNREAANREAVKLLERLTLALQQMGDADRLTLSDTFSLRFKIEENDNSTGWIDNIRMVGSDGTDILVKAILNILLISVFKQRAGKSARECRLHCMMDEIGKLADENIQGILEFANQRNIFVVNSSPKAHRPLSYRHLYVLSKDSEANTIIRPILSTKQAVLQQQAESTHPHTDEA